MNLILWFVRLVFQQSSIPFYSDYTVQILATSNNLRIPAEPDGCCVKSPPHNNTNAKTQIWGNLLIYGNITSLHDMLNFLRISTQVMRCESCSETDLTNAVRLKAAVRLTCVVDIWPILGCWFWLSTSWLPLRLLVVIGRLLLSSVFATVYSRGVISSSIPPVCRVVWLPGCHLAVCQYKTILLGSLISVHISWWWGCRGMGQPRTHQCPPLLLLIQQRDRPMLPGSVKSDIA